MINSKRIGITILVVLTIFLLGCGKTKKEEELIKDIENLESKKKELTTELQIKEGKLEEVLKTPEGMICKARTFATDDNIESRSDTALKEAEVYYLKVINDYPDCNYTEEAVLVHSLVREERAKRLISIQMDRLGKDLISITDDEIKSVETNLGNLINKFPDTKYKTNADRGLKTIDKEWSIRGKPISANEYLNNANKYEGEILRLSGKMVKIKGEFYCESQFQIVDTAWQFLFDNSDKAITWIPGDYDPLQINLLNDLGKMVRFDVYAEKGTPGFAILKAYRNGKFKVQYLILNNEIFSCNMKYSGPVRGGGGTNSNKTMVNAPKNKSNSGTVDLVIAATVGLNIRSGPDSSYEKLAKVEFRDKVKKLDEKNGWYKIRTNDGTVGWVCGGMNGEVWVEEIK